MIDTLKNAHERLDALGYCCRRADQDVSNTHEVASCGPYRPAHWASAGVVHASCKAGTAEGVAAGRCHRLIQQLHAQAAVCVIAAGCPSAQGQKIVSCKPVHIHIAAADLTQTLHLASGGVPVGLHVNPIRHSSR